MAAKFTKQIAIALANKLHRELCATRRVEVAQFMCNAEIKKDFKKKIAKYKDLSEKMKAISVELNQITGHCIYLVDSDEANLERLLKGYAEKQVKPIPAVEALTNEFLIASIDAETSEEAMALVKSRI